jgi:hypothetical protein
LLSLTRRNRTGTAPWPVDDPLAHQRGRHVWGLGWFRDAVASPRQRTATASGHPGVAVAIHRASGGKGTWVLDRRFDRIELLRPFLRREHAEIRRRCQELGNCLEVADDLENEFPRMVLRDLLTYGWELWELLDDHARTETRAVHRYLAQTFDDDTAAAQP